MVSSQLVRAWIVENRRFGDLPKILDFAFDSDENKRFVTSMDGFVLTVILFLILLSNVGVRIEVLESVVRILSFVMEKKGVKEKQIEGLILKSNRDPLLSLDLIQVKNNSESKRKTRWQPKSTIVSRSVNGTRQFVSFLDSTRSKFDQNSNRVSLIRA